MSEITEWLLLVYKMPPEPSRYRVAVWRHIKDSGAIYVQNSVCAIPKTDANVERFKSISDEIEKGGGECFMLTASPFDEKSKSRILERYNEERNLEYFEFIEQCEAFLQEIQMEIGRQNFTYAEFEENEEALKRLTSWLKKIRNRDLFSAQRSDEADSYYARCQEALEDFASRVYAANQG
ncbi:Chromate resistance protein ChrB [Coprothermobacter platensis]|jgi:hypothetical protein|uniref:Chromate resistance protein ChrB n=1 Tax=Coprothermobacter platensis TaxID=108819 RepID=UPI000360BE8B|nr:Chromate resistance protein ChrB [Coprothermobacter platensis]